MPVTAPVVTFLNRGGATAKRNIAAGMKALKKSGINPEKTQCVIDIGAGKKFRMVSSEIVGTLTASRCASRAWWLTKARPVS